MQMRYFDIWSKYNLRLPLGHHRTCSQHKQLDEAWAGIGRYLFTRSKIAKKCLKIIGQLSLLRCASKTVECLGHYRTCSVAFLLPRILARQSSSSTLLVFRPSKFAFSRPLNLITAVTVGGTTSVKTILFLELGRLSSFYFDGIENDIALQRFRALQHGEEWRTPIREKWRRKYF